MNACKTKALSKTLLEASLFHCGKVRSFCSLSLHFIIPQRCQENAYVLLLPFPERLKSFLPSYRIKRSPSRQLPSKKISFDRNQVY